MKRIAGFWVIMMVLVFFMAAAEAEESHLQDFKIKVNYVNYDVIVGKPPTVSPPCPLVIYHHGWGKRGLGQYELRTLAQRFAEAGYLFWAPERAPGGDLGTALTIAREVLALASKDPLVDKNRIALVGFSQGAVATFGVGVRSPQVKVLALLGFGTLLAAPRRHTVEESFDNIDFQKVQSKILIMVAQKDERVDLNTSRRLETLLKEAGKPYKVISYPGYTHEDLCGDKAYLKDLLAYLKENLN